MYYYFFFYSSRLNTSKLTKLSCTGSVCRALFIKTVEYVVLLNKHNYDAASVFVDNKRRLCATANIQTLFFKLELPSTNREGKGHELS